MIANKIPSVLYQSNNNSLSIERVLKMAKGLLMEAEWEKQINERLAITCIEDLEVILRNIER